jgi:hypothetical protein
MALESGQIKEPYPKTKCGNEKSSLEKEEDNDDIDQPFPPEADVEKLRCTQSLCLRGTECGLTSERGSRPC